MPTSFPVDFRYFSEKADFRQFFERTLKCSHVVLRRVNGALLYVAMALRVDKQERMCARL